MDLDKAIQERHCVRKFSKKKPNWRNIIECIDAARYAPMAGKNYTLKFIVVDEEEKIKKIAEACQQDFVAQAQFVVVVCSSPERTINLYGERGKLYVKQQAGAAIENFFLKITEFGLSTCWVGHFVEEEIKDILRCPDDIDVEAVFPIGYEFEKSRTKSTKINLNRILYFNKYGDVQMKKERSVE